MSPTLGFKLKLRLKIHKHELILLLCVCFDSCDDVLCAQHFNFMSFSPVTTPLTCCVCVLLNSYSQRKLTSYVT